MTNCKQCGVEIPQASAKIWDGYCKPHSRERMSAGDLYYQDTVTRVVFGILPERVNNLMKDFKQGDVLIRHKSSPFSWACQCGLGGHVIKRKGVVAKAMWTEMN